MDTYRSAKHTMIAVIAVLQAWILIGFDILAPAEVEFGALKIRLANPTVIPYVICILLAYSVYRVVIEWLALEPETRTRRVYSFDYKVSLYAAWLTMEVFFVSELCKDLANERPHWVVQTWSAGFVLGLAVLILVLRDHQVRAVFLGSAPTSEPIRSALSRRVLPACVFIVIAVSLMNWLLLGVPLVSVMSLLLLSFFAHFFMPAGLAALNWRD